MPGSVIVSGKRTPIGKLSGAFAGMSAGELGTVAIKGASTPPASPASRSSI